MNKDKFGVDDIDLFFHQEFNDLLDGSTVKINEDAEILNLDDINTLDKNIEILNLDNIGEKIDILDLEDIDNSKMAEILDLDEPIYSAEVLNFDVENSNLLLFNKEMDLVSNNPEMINSSLENKKGVKKKKYGIKKIILMVDLIILLILLVLVILKILRWNNDNNYTKKQIQKTLEDATITEVTDNDSTIIVENKDEIPDNDYYNFISEPLMEVNIDKLKAKNSDTVGWIKVNGTNINYPIVQTANNEYYLNHSFDKSYNDAGWLFADYRNNLYDDKNLIIYGHARLNLTMFGTLKNVVKPNWYNESSNHVIKLSTIHSNTSWLVFSTYIINNEDYYLKTFFNRNEEYLSFLNTLKERSVYNYNVSLNENDKILTLSSCYTDNRRVVLHAKLIKQENR